MSLKSESRKGAIHMAMKFSSALASTLVLSACATGAGGGGDTGMAYAVSATNPLVYERGDTVAVSVEVEGMGTMGLNVHQAYTVSMAMEPSASGVQVTADFLQFSGRMTNPMAGPTTASERDITGTLVYTMDGRGHGSLVSAPEIRGGAAQMFSPGVFVRQGLPLLPPRGSEVGDMWGDTLSFSANQGDQVISVVWTGTSTLVGDTLIDGVTLTKVSVSAHVEMESSGALQGMEMVQSTSGRESGFYLWDTSRRVITYLESGADLSGEVEVSVAPAPMPLSVERISRMRLMN